MPRIEPLNSADASAKTRAALDGIQKKLGVVPNVVATIAHSPAALQAYLGFGQGLGGGTLGPAVREQIALVVAGANSCGYCASAHTVLGRNAGVADEELARNLRGDSADPRVQAALDFAGAIVSRKGWIEQGDLASVRAAGFSDGEVIEIVATVSINIFTNYVNHIAGTEIDFPEVSLPEPATA